VHLCGRESFKVFFVSLGLFKKIRYLTDAVKVQQRPVLFRSKKLAEEHM
jgi:hypothetical protein